MNLAELKILASGKITCIQIIRKISVECNVMATGTKFNQEIPNDSTIAHDSAEPRRKIKKIKPT